MTPEELRSTSITTRPRIPQGAARHRRLSRRSRRCTRSSRCPTRSRREQAAHVLGAQGNFGPSTSTTPEHLDTWCSPRCWRSPRCCGRRKRQRSWDELRRAGCRAHSHAPRPARRHVRPGTSSTCSRSPSERRGLTRHAAHKRGPIPCTSRSTARSPTPESSPSSQSRSCSTTPRPSRPSPSRDGKPLSSPVATQYVVTSPRANR